MPKPPVIVLFSGGLDSTVLLHHIHAAGREAIALTFITNEQNSPHQLAAAKAIIKSGTPARKHLIYDLRAIATIFANNALTSPTATLPTGEDTWDHVKQTAVANRNQVFLALAYAYGASHGTGEVAIACMEGLYPDTRKTYFSSFLATQRRALQGLISPVSLFAPFTDWGKSEVIMEGLALKAPLHLTRTCHSHYPHPCGVCGTCTDRADAFHTLNMKDPALIPAKKQRKRR